MNCWRWAGVKLAKEGGGAVTGLGCICGICCNGCDIGMVGTWLARRFFAADMEAALLIVYWFGGIKSFDTIILYCLRIT